ncbi:hypothetical protein MOVS_00690 [Moraxella ovis]|uniref:Uncharacterized protein n=1 Tax=Moraxella ovis TaxID=29433 RepID=A0ABM6BAL2_9GAMM|nr:hypothetical protein [Moraxella ovis]ANB90760.1 hypothetical protein MOVS_00690 [Moraxella ovis]
MSTKLKNKRISQLLFVGVVIIPWIAIIAYVLLLANPRYVSTSNVVIKQVSEQAMSASGISALLCVNNTSRDNALYLTKYILSDDMIDKLDKKFEFRKNYHLTGSDFIFQKSGKRTIGFCDHASSRSRSASERHQKSHA